MTLLSLIQDAASEIGVAVPTVVVGNTDPAAQRMLRHAHRVGLDLVARGSWEILRAQHAFDATPGEEQLDAVPADMDRMIAETMWDRDHARLISGPVRGSQWQSLVATQPIGSISRWFTLRGGKVYIYPGMQGAEEMAFEYFSRNYCASSGGTAQQRWALDTDVGRLPEELFTLGVIAFYLRSEGLPFEHAMADYELRMQTEAANDQPRSGILSAGDVFGGERAWGGSPAPGPDGSYGADGSIGLLG